MAGKKKKAVKKVDPSMYSTASKPKAVKVTERGEDAMRDLVRKEEPAADTSAGAAVKAKPRAVRAMQRIVGRLLLDGFSPADIEAAVNTLGAAAGPPPVAEDELERALLDRLCLDVRPLPPVFANAHVTDDAAHPLSFVAQAAKEAAGAAPAAVEDDEAAAAKAAAREAEYTRVQDAYAQQRKAKEEAERQAALDYIRRREEEKAAAAAAAAERGYDSDMSFTDSSDSEELRMLANRNMGGTAYGQTSGKGKKKGKGPQQPAGGGGGGGRNDGAAAVLPEVAAMKKALRRCADDDVETQQRCLAEAMVRLRKGAAAAKASGEKASQQAYGKGIAEVNELLVEYDLTQKTLQPLMDEAAKGMADEAPAPAPTQPKADEQAPKAAPPSLGSEDDDWVPPEEGGLFEDGGAGGAEGASTEVQTKLREPSKEAVGELLQQLGLKEKDREAKHAPRSLLQRWCNAANGSKPMFAVHATEAVDSGAKPGHRYAVTLRLGNGRNTTGAAEVVADDGTAWYRATSDGHDAAAVCGLHHAAPQLPFYALMAEQWSERWRACFVAAQLETKNVDLATALADQLTAAGARGGVVPSAAAPAAQHVDPQARSKPPPRAPPASDAAPTAREAETSRTLQAELKALPSRVKPAVQAVRDGLPAVALKGPLAEAMREHDFVVVAGDTGCGKTTQVPQYLLDEGIAQGAGGATFVVCTQPRRVAAMSVAKRVAEERGEPAPTEKAAGRQQQGGGPRRVGYHVRFGAGHSRDTRLLFCTVGILLRRMAGDPQLAEVSHVVVDEVHERSLDGDFALAQLKALSLLRRARGLRPLKIIAMSATVDPGLFSSYLDGCPILTVEGRTFPVTRTFLEDVYDMTGYELDLEGKAAYKAASSIDDVDADDWEVNPRNPRFKARRYEGYPVSVQRNLAMVNEDVLDHDLVVATVDHIDAHAPPGAVLVFVPGYANIQLLTDLLVHGVRHDVRQRRRVVPLHSSVSWEVQQTAFVPPPDGVRKIVIATNIAETSITVNDVVYVVDTGKAKQLTHNHDTNIAALQETWISKAAAKQRMGRAGRVQEGHCYCLYTRDRHASFDAFEEPEILRTSLAEICLQAKVMCPDRHPKQVLMATIQPPPEERVVTAVQELLDVGVLARLADGGDALKLTVLGRHLSRLPVDIRVGKLLLIGAFLGVAAPCVAIAAALSGKSPFLTGEGQRAGRVAFEQRSGSDHVVLANVYEAWRAARKAGRHGRFCAEHRLDGQVLETIHDTRTQLVNCLIDADILPSAAASILLGGAAASDPPPAWNAHAAKPYVVKAAVCYAFQPNVAVLKARLPTHTVWTYANRDAYLQHASVNAGAGTAVAHPYVVFHNILTTKQAYISDSSVVPPAALLLFASSAVVQHRARAVLVNDWLAVDAPAQVAVIATGLRALMQELMEQRLDGGGEGEAQLHEQSAALLAPVVEFLEQNH